MKNPFAAAMKLGYKPDQLLSFLSGTDKKLSKKIAQAAAMGYGAKEIANFLAQSGRNAKEGKDKQFQAEYAEAMKAIGSGGVETGKQKVLAQRQADKPEREEGRSAAKKIALGIAGAVAAPALMGAAGGLAAGAARAAPAIEGMAGAEAASMLSPSKAFEALKAGGVGDLFAQAALKSKNMQGATREVIKQVGPEFIQKIGEHFGESPKNILSQAYEFVMGDSMRGANQNVGSVSPGTMQAAAQDASIQTPDIEVEDMAVETPTADLDIQEESRRQMPIQVSYDMPGVSFEKPDIVPGNSVLKTPAADLDIQEVARRQAAQGPRFEGEELPVEPSLEGRAMKPVQRMKSSNVSQASFDPESKQLQVLFRPSKDKKGQIYQYEGVTDEDITKFMQGQGAAKTMGSSDFGVWYKGKDPSIGAALNEYVKRKDESGKEVYKVNPIDVLDVKDTSILDARDADIVDRTTLFVDAFDKLNDAKLAKQRAKALKETDERLSQTPIEELQATIFRIVRSMKQQDKKAGKTKRRLGGKEQYVTDEVIKYYGSQ